MYSVVMVVAMAGAPEVPACDLGCFKSKCNTTACAPKCAPKVSCAPACAPAPVCHNTCAPTCHTPKCGLFKCFSFGKKCGHGHNRGCATTECAAPSGCGTTEIAPAHPVHPAPVSPAPGGEKKDMPKTGPAPKAPVG